MTRENGEPNAVHEVRLLQGRPVKSSLDRAFAAELNWRRRAFYVMSETLGGRVIAGPMTFSAGGKQRVAIAAGSGLFAFALPGQAVRQ